MRNYLFNILSLAWTGFFIGQGDLQNLVYKSQLLKALIK